MLHVLRGINQLINCQCYRREASQAWASWHIVCEQTLDNLTNCCVNNNIDSTILMKLSFFLQI